MLGKLYKHEFRATARIQLPLMLATIAVTLVLTILVLLNKAIPEGTILYTLTNILTGFMSAFYVLGLVAYILAAHLLGVQRYYKNLFTDEGYLTLTLPVKNGYHQTVKLTVAVFWSLVSILISALCFAAFLLIGIESAVSPAELIHRITGLQLSGEAIGFAVVLALSVLIMEIFFFTLAYFSIAAGQTFSKKHKVAAAFVTYIIVQSILQIAALILMGTGAVILDDVLTRLFANIHSPMASFSAFLLVWDALSLVISGAFFGVTNYLTHHRLNLE